MGRSCLTLRWVSSQLLAIIHLQLLLAFAWTQYTHCDHPKERKTQQKNTWRQKYTGIEEVPLQNVRDKMSEVFTCQPPECSRIHWNTSIILQYFCSLLPSFIQTGRGYSNTNAGEDVTWHITRVCVTKICFISITISCHVTTYEIGLGIFVMNNYNV